MEWYEIIKGLREDNDMTQTELGKVLNCSQIAISQYERGIRQITPKTIIEYAKYFNVSTDYILGLSNNPEPSWKKKTRKKNTVNIKNSGNGNITTGNINQS